MWFAWLFVIGAVLTVAAVLYHLRGELRGEFRPSTPAKEKDWYAYGPWRCEGEGSAVVITDGAKVQRIWMDGIYSEPRAYITMDMARAAKAVSYRNSGYGERAVELSDLPTIRLHCAWLNQRLYEKAQIAGWAEVHDGSSGADL